MSLSRLFIRKVIQEMNDEKREGLHVSDLVTLSNCPRMFWYEKKHWLPPDIDNLLKMWHGRKLHDISLGDLHEFELEVEGVKGRIDDYISFLKILIDKKFVTYLPKDDREAERYYSHYILQLKLYSYMLTIHGYPVREARLLFINIGDKTPFREYVFEPNIDECEQLFHELKRRAEEILTSDRPPNIPDEYDPSDYPCTYCKYRAVCLNQDAMSEKHAENE